MDGHNNTSNSALPLESVSDTPRCSAPRLDPDKYADDIKNYDFDAKQAREFLQTLWDILLMCSDVEGDIDPVSLICGQNEKTGLSRPFAASGMVKSQVNSDPENTTDTEAQ